jgi:hypothetical protein
MLIEYPVDQKVVLMYQAPPPKTPSRSWRQIIQVAVIMELIAVILSLLLGYSWQGIIYGTGFVLIIAIVFIAERWQR